MLLVPSVWAKNACVMPNSKSGVSERVATKIRYGVFFELNQMAVRTPQVTYARDTHSSRISTGSMSYFQSHENRKNAILGLRSGAFGFSSGGLPGSGSVR